jgi:hypothetical protein
MKGPARFQPYPLIGCLTNDMGHGMTIRLDLTHHCIETAIKRRRNAAISCYFKSSHHQPDLEEEIALLGQALETFDFNRLRSQWTTLAGHSDVTVTLNHGPAGQPALAFDNVLIVPPANPA